MKRILLPMLAFAIVSSGCSSGRGGGKPNGNGNNDLSVPDMAMIPVDVCSVPPEATGIDNAGEQCTVSAPPNSFTPEIKWSWTAPGAEATIGSIVMPLVGNFTDDNHDGKIDLCDIPDILITTGSGGIGGGGHIYMLAGDTGALEKTFATEVDGSVTPAFADLDGDGIPEIVANDVSGHLIAFNANGTVKWTGPSIGAYKQVTASYCHAIAIYDLDGDGKPEIIAGFEVFDNKGKMLFGKDESSFDGHYWCPANTAADLDGDGKLEVIFGNAAYHSDGTVYWTIPGPPGQPQVANLDSDPDPEIFIAREDGILILEHDGTIKLGPVKLINEPTSPNCWSKPGAIHDFDGDGIADVSASTCGAYGVYKVTGNTLTLNWQAKVDDTSGLASTTAFDFLGRGVAQAVYGDQVALYIFDGKTGALELTSPRSSGTLIEYPVVADVDNDHSADIVVVSNGGGYKHTVDVIQDQMRRWIPTRRIWNQHAYHVTNIREDGTVPKHMNPNWKALNTFRTNAQINGNNAACAPPIP